MPTVDINNNPPELMIMCMRQGFWDCLREKVPNEVVRTGRTVSKVEQRPNGKLILEFTNGAKSDGLVLIIGADGVKSVVKNAMKGGEGKHAKPIYKGLCGIGGFVRSSYFPPLPSDLVHPASQSPAVMTFRPKGFFGYSPCNSALGSGSQPLTASQMKQNNVIPYGPQAMWWSTFSTDNPRQSTTAVIDKKPSTHSSSSDS
jgi:2-polyprenyl-6-methoxyphenol hydroxylase-like FAD-dependent oxidoreductase